MITLSCLICVKVKIIRLNKKASDVKKQEHSIAGLESDLSIDISLCFIIREGNFYTDNSPAIMRDAYQLRIKSSLTFKRNRPSIKSPLICALTSNQACLYILFLCEYNHIDHFSDILNWKYACDFVILGYQ